MIYIIAKAVVAGTPLLLASMGEVISERSGVLNLGIEGVFVFGSAAAFTVTVLTKSIYLGLFVSGLVGVIIGILHGLVSVSFRGHQVVSGLALTIFGYGAASLIGKGLVGQPLPAYISAESIWWVLILFGILFSLILWYVIFQLKIGAMLRAVGEDPHSAEVLGVDVVKVRIIATIIGSFVIGVGGGWYTLGYLHIWTEGLGVGRGWISLAIVIVSGWNPILIPIFSYLFGGIEAAIWRLQLPPYNVDPYLLGIIPYLTTLAALTIFMATPLKKIFKPPASLGLVYYKEERTV